MEKDYKSKDYWESRYKTEESYEWFNSGYQEILKHIKDYCKDIHGTYLHIGCGNSKLGIEMQKEYLLNTDYSDIVVNNMSIHRGEWSVMNILNLPLRSESIDVIIDKGTLDALLHGSVVLWNPVPELVQEAYQALNEIYRVLSPDGFYIYATFGQPHFRKPLLKLANLEIIDTIIIGEAFHYFVYIVKKINDKIFIKQ